MNKLDLTIISTPDSISQVEDFIERVIGEFQLPECLRGKITLSVAEAVNNAILFGNKRDASKQVRVSASKDCRKVVFTVEDEGAGFDFSTIPDPTTPENLGKTTGRGLYLMTRLTDGLSFARNGATVIMTYSITNSSKI